MKWLTTITSLLPRKRSRRQTRKFYRFQPTLEVLETRLAPAAPATPNFSLPFQNGAIVPFTNVQLETNTYFDPDGDAHASTDWELFTANAAGQPIERVWSFLGATGQERIHTDLGDGTFEGSHAGRREALPDTLYLALVRHRDASGEVSEPGIRNFRTSTIVPGDPNNQWVARQPGFVTEVVSTNYQLPVGIAFVPDPGTGDSAPLYYVAELYGAIKTVLRDGTVVDYATNLLNFNPTGAFPGSGEQGIGGILVDPSTGDVLISQVYSLRDFDDTAPHYGRVVRFQSTDGGRTASTSQVVLDTGTTYGFAPNLVQQLEAQGQSHQISNISIGPDGKLYVHNGEGFDVARAQDIGDPGQRSFVAGLGGRGSFGGKILRLNLDDTPTSQATPVVDNPLFNAGDGITARDYIFAWGFRNPFGGAWRDSDGSHFTVENGPETNDRLSQLVAGRNYLWNGSAQSMTNFAIFNWNPPQAPVNVAIVQPTVFGGSQFPTANQDHLFVSLSGPTYGQGPQAQGKRIQEFVVNSNGVLVSAPTTLAEYIGTGRGSVAALAVGPDGLYFSDLYRNDGIGGPTARGANIWRVRFVGIGVPPAPTNLRVMNFCSSEIEVAWNASPTATGYRIERATGDGPFVEIAVVGANQTFFVDTELAQGTYTYRVRAFNDTGDSATHSNTVTFRLQPPEPVVIDRSAGFADQSGFTRSGSAVFVGDIVRLTADAANQAGGFFTSSPVGITNFTTTFTFQIRNGTTPPADGMAFVIQGAGPTALGPSGGGLGYGPDNPAAGSAGGIPNSLAIKFDIFDNAGEGGNSTGLFVNGRSPTSSAPGTPNISINLDGSGIDLRSQHVFRVDVDYDGGTLRVTIRDTDTGATATQSYQINIPTLVVGETAFVGFTGGTGGLTAFQEVQTWRYESRLGAPGAPVDLRVTNSTETQVSLAWRCRSFDENGFLVERSQDGVHFVLVGTTGPNVTSFTDTPGAAGLYFYRVRAFNDQGDSAPTNTAVAVLAPKQVDHPDFATSNDLRANGSAVFTDNLARLTPTANSQTGTFFTGSRVSAETFSTNFTFRIHSGTTPPADGMTFVIHNDPRGASAVGVTGNGLGYQGIGRSVAIKFDIFGETESGTGLYINGAPPTAGTINLLPAGINFRNGNVHRADVTYDGTTLFLTITDTVTGASFTTSFTVDIHSIVGDDTAYAGFTAATGGLNAAHDVLSWCYIAPPVIGRAGFTADATVLCDVPATVQFTNTSTIEGATSVLWDFGDGTTSTELNPVHTYTRDGLFTVRLTVTSPLGVRITTKPDFISVGRTGFRAEYFNDLNNFFNGFAGTPAVTRIDATINLNDASGPPAAGIGVDNFAVRWTGVARAPVTGTYVFRTRTDDGVRLFVNNQLIINNPTDHGPTDDVGRIFLQAGLDYDIRMEFYERGGGALAQLFVTVPGSPEQLLPGLGIVCPVPLAGTVDFFTRLGDASAVPLAVQFDNRSTVPNATGFRWDFGDGTTSDESDPLHVYEQPGVYTVRLFVSTPGFTRLLERPAYVTVGQNGLRAEYFLARSDTVQVRLPDYEPAVTRIDPTVDLNTGGSPIPGFITNDHFMVRWTGQILPTVNGAYTFRTVADDGIRLWVGNELIIDNWVFQGPTSNTAIVAMAANRPQDIKVEYFEAGGGALAQVFWTPPGQSEELLPTNLLFPTPTSAGLIAPSNLRFTGTTVSGITLAWNDNSGNEDNFIVERSTDGVAFVQIVRLGANVTTFTDRPEQGGTYFYRVLAVNDLALSRYTNTVSTTFRLVDFSAGFPANPAGLTRNGSANTAFSDGVARLTPALNGQTGTMFTTTAQVIGRFTNDFTFQITPGTLPMADGMTFTIQSVAPTALGVGGNGLGYEGIGRSVAIKFDIIGEGESLTGLYTNGAPPSANSIDLLPDGIDLRSGNVFRVNMTYDGSQLAVC